MLKVGFLNLNHLYIKCIIIFIITIIIIIFIIIIIIIIIIIDTYTVQKRKLHRNCDDRCYYFKNQD